jgi:hypothetical protein
VARREPAAGRPRRARRDGALPAALPRPPARLARARACVRGNAPAAFGHRGPDRRDRRLAMGARGTWPLARADRGGRARAVAARARERARHPYVRARDGVRRHGLVADVATHLGTRGQPRPSPRRRPRRRRGGRAVDARARSRRGRASGPRRADRARRRGSTRELARRQRPPWSARGGHRDRCGWRPVPAVAARHARPRLRPWRILDGAGSEPRLAVQPPGDAGRRIRLGAR